MRLKDSNESYVAANLLETLLPQLTNPVEQEKVADIMKYLRGEDVYHIVHVDRSYVWDKTDAQDQWAEFNAANGVQDPEPLSDRQVENVFMFLNENEDLHAEIRDCMRSAMEDGAAKYYVDAEVYWNDPDDGLCSQHAIVKEVRFLPSETVYLLQGKDGQEIEALESELA